MHEKRSQTAAGYDAAGTARRQDLPDVRPFIAGEDIWASPAYPVAVRIGEDGRVYRSRVAGDA